MNDGTNDNFAVSFPASETFARIGRVAVAGLALRLGVDISSVERLRRAVDNAVEALKGDGVTEIEASWHKDQLRVQLSNSKAQIVEQAKLAELLSADVGRAVVENSSVVLELNK